MASPYTCKTSPARQQWAIAARYAISVLIASGVALVLPQAGAGAPQPQVPAGSCRWRLHCSHWIMKRVLPVLLPMHA